MTSSLRDAIQNLFDALEEAEYDLPQHLARAAEDAYELWLLEMGGEE